MFDTNPYKDLTEPTTKEILDAGFETAIDFFNAGLRAKVVTL